MEFDLLTLPGGGVDLLDFYRGKLSLRRLVVLLHELDPRSRVKMEMVKREHGNVLYWGDNEKLLTKLTNEMTILSWKFDCFVIAKNTKEGQKPKLPDQPELIYPPGYEPEAKKEKKKFASAKEIAGFFGQLNKT